MRASPPIDIALSRCGPWLAFVIVIAVASLLVVATWLALGMGGPARTPTLPAMVVGGLALFLACRALLAGWPPNGRLRWNGRCWALTSGEGEPVAGDVTVALDLGGWLLLRFVAERQHGGAVRWLPLQRRGREDDWHALRCAIHAGHAGTDSA
jgi:hypothetical protein